MRRTYAPPPANLKLPSKLAKPEVQPVYPLKLITPMFGGGYIPRAIDRLNPIRSAAVRGHLRQWWRAIVGATYSTPASLYKAEQDLWGSAQKPGRVGVYVEIAPEELRSLPGRLINGDYERLPAYATLGLKSDNREGIRAAEGLIELAFTVRLNQSPDRPPLTADEWQQVQQAVSAWIQFGGIGARTRRGCGSIGLTSAITLPEITLGAPKNRHNSPLTLLEQSHCYSRNASSAQGAWESAVGIYQNFRQTPTGRPEGRPRPGRSRWPEPNTLRNIISTNRTWAHTVPPGAPTGFPRAEFGLPIIFHFKADPGTVEPKDVTLQGSKAGRLRFASPIITKAMQVGLDRYVTLVLVLDSPKVSFYGDLALSSQERFTPGKASVSAEDVQMKSADRAATTPMNGLEAREAFEAFLASKLFASGYPAGTLGGATR